MSPYDEGAHFDYVTQILDGDFPVPAGTHYTDETIQTWACRPNDKAFPLSGLCGQPRPVDDAGIPFLGVNYEAQFGPLYYLLAATGTKLLGPFGVGHFGAARLVSATVYALGVALLMFVAQRLAVSSWAAAGVLLAASATGLSLSTGSTVTPDSMAFLYTAGVVWAAVLVRPWRSAVISTASVCALAGLTKPNFIVLAALGAALLLLRSLNAEPRVRNINAEARLLGAVAAPVLASAVAAGAWGLSARCPCCAGRQYRRQRPRVPTERPWLVVSGG